MSKQQTPPVSAELVGVRVLLILGRQGSGKGTQCALMNDQLRFAHVSTGDLLRSAVETDSPLGRRAADVMRAGDLMPDDVMCEIIRERLAAAPAGSTIVLDGFPRTIAQAEALEAMTLPGSLLGAIVLNAPVGEVSGRMHERGRTDDTAEGITRRLALYEEQTVPLISWLSSRGLAREVNGVGCPEEVFERVVEAVEALSGSELKVDA